MCALAAALSATGCIEDAVSSSPSDQPSFSTDTVRMGELFTLDASPTHRFVVYNRHDKVMNISEIAFRGDAAGQFRLNVDGQAGSSFHNMEVRPNDSIFVFVEATLAENSDDLPVQVLAWIDFRVNGVTSSLPVKATAQDVVRFSGNTRYSTDASLPANRPCFISDSLVVEPDATLTIPAGARLLMHEESEIIVHGTLRIAGTAEKPVSIAGHRTGFVAAQIPYEVMSGQWGGIRFTSTSRSNEILHASIRNSTYGLRLEHAGGDAASPALVAANSVLRNSKGYVVDATLSSVALLGCELAEAAMGVVSLQGGDCTINQCSLGNYYLFSAVGGPLLQVGHYDLENGDSDDGLPAEMPLNLAVANSIFCGYGGDLNVGDFTGFPVTFTNCLLQSAGSNDDNFINCLWETDPGFNIDRHAYIFDYRVGPTSPALEYADPALWGRYATLLGTDINGDARTPSPTAGAYQRPRE